MLCMTASTSPSILTPHCSPRRRSHLRLSPCWLPPAALPAAPPPAAAALLLARQPRIAAAFSAVTKHEPQALSAPGWPSAAAASATSSSCHFVRCGVVCVYTEYQVLQHCWWSRVRLSVSVVHSSCWLADIHDSDCCPHTNTVHTPTGCGSHPVFSP